MTISKEITNVLADEALDVFWQSVVRHFPHARTGDLSWNRQIALKDAAAQAIAEWLENNVPDVAA